MVTLLHNFRANAPTSAHSISKSKRLVSFYLGALLVFLLIPGGAMAQDMDAVGIYFDGGTFTEPRIDGVGSGEAVTGYLVLSNPSTPTGVGGWECCVGIDGPAIFLDWVIEGQNINVLAPPCFMVGIGGDPLPDGPNILLATFQILVQEEEPILLTLNPVYHASIPDQMAYLPGDDPNILIPMTSTTGAPEVAWINAGAPMPVLDCTSVQFGTLPLGTLDYYTVNLRNIGGGPLPVNIGISGTNGAFYLPEISGNTVVEPGENIDIVVAFIPTETIQYLAYLEFGDFVPAIPIMGQGRDLIYDWFVVDAVDFGEIQEGSYSTREVFLVNTGELPIPLDVAITEGGEHFSVDYNGPQDLAIGASVTFTVTFDPVGGGSFDGLLGMGSIIPAITLHGATIDSPIHVYPLSLDFQNVVLGESRTLEFSVYNPAQHAIEVTPTADCAAFSVDGNSFLLAPGETSQVAVQFLPQTLGYHNCVIDLGPEVEGNVACVGRGVDIPLTGDNELGFFFDPQFSQRETQTWGPSQIITGYLVLTHATEPSGIGGWECCVSITQPALFLSWQLEGSALNISTPPCFTVGIGGEPLPYAENILLATVDIFVPFSGYESMIYVGPTSTPSIPGQMAFLAGDDPDNMMVMTPIDGYPIVAMINTSPLAAGAEAPQVVANGGAVDLQWSVPDFALDGFHVYRSSGSGLAVRANEELLVANAGTLNFTDHPQGFAPGDVLSYSYGVMHEGVEIARSPEVEVTLGTTPRVTTRLLANIPNPFNPQTSINFEVSGSQRVRVNIFDVTGRKVRTLVDSHYEAGPHSKIWEGRDDRGRQVPSGAYYVRMESGSTVDHRKIMLLK